MLEAAEVFEESGVGELGEEETATVSVVPVIAPADELDEEVDDVDADDDDEATGPVPASIATTGAAVPVVAPVPVIGPGLVPG